MYENTAIRSLIREYLMSYKPADKNTNIGGKTSIYKSAIEFVKDWWSTAAAAAGAIFIWQKKDAILGLGRQIAASSPAIAAAVQTVIKESFETKWGVIDSTQAEEIAKLLIDKIQKESKPTIDEVKDSQLSSEAAVTSLLDAEKTKILSKIDNIVFICSNENRSFPASLRKIGISIPDIDSKITSTQDLDENEKKYLRYALLEVAAIKSYNMLVDEVAEFFAKCKINIDDSVTSNDDLNDRITRKLESKMKEIGSDMMSHISTVKSILTVA